MNAVLDQVDEIYLAVLGMQLVAVYYEYFDTRKLEVPFPAATPQLVRAFRAVMTENFPIANNE